MEASRFLGITQELLYAYVRSPAKRVTGQTRRLAHVHEAGQNKFRRSDLEDFDNYLKEPWINEGAARPDVPKFIEEYLKVESSGQCANCGRGNNLKTAHIVEWAVSRSHHHHNLIRLCSDCHDQFDTKPHPLITRDQIVAAKQRLVEQVCARLIDTPFLRQPSVHRMPNPAYPFIGREDEITAVVEALRAKRSVAIQGVGGIGKTQVLLHALSQGADTRPVYWIGVEGYRSVSEIEGAVFGALAGSTSPIATTSLVDALAQAEVRVVFDGVEQLSPTDMDDLDDFFQGLITMTTAPQFIFTSQVEMTAISLEQRITLKGLDAEDGLFLLESIGTDAGPVVPGADEHLLWLRDFCDGHPLSLFVVIGLLRHFKAAAVVADQIRQSGSSVLQHPTRRKQTTSTSLGTCLRVSYQTLTPEQKRMLWIVAQCPAGCAVGQMEIIGREALSDVEGDIAALRRWHLLNLEIDFFDQRRLFVLSPVAAFIIPEWEAEDPQVSEVLYRDIVENLTIHAGIITHHRIQSGDAQLGLLRFEQEAHNFLHALHLAVTRADRDGTFNRWAGLLASTFMVFCFVRGHFALGIEIMKVGANAWTREGSVASACDLLLHMLMLAHRSYNIQVMRSAASELITLAQKTQEPRPLACVELAMGELATVECHWEIAARHFEAAEHYWEQDISSTDDPLKPMVGDSGENLFLGPDHSAQEMLGLTLKARGFVHERQGQPAEALSCYERALLISRETGDQINEPAILHSIGNCAADLGQYERAQEAYVSAAIQFGSLAVTDYLSNSLSELGHLLVSHHPQKPVDELVSAELLAEGLIDVSKQVADLFLQTAGFGPWEDPLRASALMDCCRKAFGMFALASFLTHNGLLREWAEQLRENVLVPLSPAPGDRFMLDQFPLMLLDVTLALAGAISGVKQPNGVGQEPELSEIQHYAYLCYCFTEWGWTAFRPFDWLSTYLHNHRQMSVVPAFELLDSIRVFVENGETFSCEDPTVSGPDA